MKVAPVSRVAFVHVMKTAGSFVDQYLTQRVFLPDGYRCFNSWANLERDWTLEELEEIREEQHRRAYVHNHAGGWDEGSVRGFRDAGWFAFAFVRHPGDRWCSFYHWAQGRPLVRGLTLDAFLRCAFSGGFPLVSPNLDVPGYWRSLDFVEEFSPEAFARLLENHFSHVFDATAIGPVNVSGNPGYNRYLEEGRISRATDELVRTSAQFEIYEAIRERSRRETSARS